MAYVLSFAEIDRTQLAVVGGKGANLGELSRVDGVRVPDGFCVTTAAYARVVAGVPEGLFDELSRLDPGDREATRVLSARARAAIEEQAIPDDVTAEIVAAHARLGADGAYAVRSSATAEDLPTASFAGQQDSYLNIVGAAELLAHVRRCWGSLFTERAVAYRQRNGFGHRGIRMAVVVQAMVFPRAAGVLVTADPVSSDRTVTSIDAAFGLGEALVSGLVNADNVRVRGDAIIARATATKKLAVEPEPAGGTAVREIAPARRDEPVLTDAEALALARLGRRIEAHFGSPQDIEWCLGDDGVLVVQSRPVTTLFPIPDGEGDRVYVSVGHQQMMTDAMKPLGISLWQLTSTAPMRDAGGRLFVDVTAALAAPASRAALVDALGTSDPLLGDALRTLIDRRGLEIDAPDRPNPATVPDPPDLDPATIGELIAESEASLAVLERDIRPHTGAALLDFIRADIEELRRVLFDPRGLALITAAMAAAEWLNARLLDWLGERNAADALTRSVPGNVTSEMGLALLDVADAVRAHPEVVAYLRAIEHAAPDDFLDRLPAHPGGAEARAALADFLERYGMRCAGEIDITRPRWREQPATLLPAILGNVAAFEPGAAARQFADGLREAEQAKQRILRELRALPDGAAKAAATERMIDRVRAFSGYREYPKYGMVCRYSVYRQALRREAERLVAAGVLHAADDIHYLRFDELREVAATHRADPELIAARRAAFRAHEALTPPRVLTSDGEVVTGAYRRTDLPADALPGTPVSTGAVEGRARVLTDLAQADLEPGDILVTAYTDPSWTPLFVAIAGLVTEAGGLMTHGAVIAREYGLPAVVGVEHATTFIRDGQRIRVHGTDGYVELLPDR
ncbi:rifamycin-inactivating phosphotransferase [Nocardia sp. NPDC057353]|uniref:rifamycin-inactivating phosphotransferase n=1 Tax=Nocardia sp. NPDC057353 TaxID=3346104 RepID=UPI00363F1F21